MNRLIIAEKPSVAQSLAAVLNAKKREDGFLIGSGYIVSWCVGHLAELADAEAYHSDYAKWRRDDLPILPENFRFTVREDRRKQFDILRGLMRRDDVQEVINACDAGREGELIFRTVYALAGCTKPIKRLWISSMEDEAIHKGFQSLKPGREYDGLHQSALCRAKADWLVGINATRLFSILYNRTLNVGRVVSPTLALIVQREAEIGAFQPEPFYTVNLDCGDFTAASEKHKQKADAQAIIAACRDASAAVQSVERKEKTEKPPALYDLTTLQRDANRLLSYTAQQTLDYLQALYEKKLCTYPRTDSRYLTADMEATVPAFVTVAASLCDAPAPDESHPGQVCDSSKVSDHHAILPTSGAGKADVSALPIGEREILRLVSRGLLCAVSATHRFAETSATLECGGHSFTVKGKTVIVPGWKVYVTEQTDKPLPDIHEGQAIIVRSVAIKEGKTSPPKHFTEDSILAAMETAGAKDIPEDAERKGLGTPATRAAILEKLVSTGFVERKKAKKAVNLLPTQIGVSLITVLPEQLQSPHLTAEWEHQLKQIEHGELDAAAFMGGISAMMGELVRTYEPVQGAEVLFPSRYEIIGKCPRCGGSVAEMQKGFFCQSADCKFALWKNNRFFTAKKKNLTKSVVTALLKDGRVNLTGCYSERTGKTYDAIIVLTDDGGKTEFKMEFGGQK